jgi:hypothetical protein
LAKWTIAGVGPNESPGEAPQDRVLFLRLVFFKPAGVSTESDTLEGVTKLELKLPCIGGAMLMNAKLPESLRDAVFQARLAERHFRSRGDSKAATRSGPCVLVLPHLNCWQESVCFKANKRSNSPSRERTRFTRSGDPAPDLTLVSHCGL